MDSMVGSASDMAVSLLSVDVVVEVAFVEHPSLDRCCTTGDANTNDEYEAVRLAVNRLVKRIMN